MIPSNGCTKKLPTATAVYAQISGGIRSRYKSLRLSRRSFRVPCRMSLLHAIGVLGHCHRGADPSPAHVVAVHDLSMGVGEHGFLTHAAAERDENQSNRYFCHTASLRGGRMVAQ